MTADVPRLPGVMFRALLVVPAIVMVMAVTLSARRPAD